MIGPLFREIAVKHNLTVASGMAYGMLGGCFVTLWEDLDVERISIYVGPQEPPAPGYAESRTVSCAQQICHTISTASGPDNLYALMTGSETIPALVLNHSGSVVTVNFPATPESRNGIERFIDELLPQIAQLTRPKHCILCFNETQGDAVPVRLSADTAVPMHADCCQHVMGQHALSPAERATQRRATLMTALGELLGAIVWAFLFGFGPFAWISGVLMGLLPALAYDRFKGLPGKPRFATILTCTATAVALGALGACLVHAFVGWSAERTLMDAYAVGYWAYAVAAFRFPVTGMLKHLLQALLIGLILGAVGSLPFLLRRKEAAAPSASAQADKPRRLPGKI